MPLLFDRRPILMAIVGAFGVRAAGRAVAGGADLVQVRAAELTGGALLRLVREVIEEVGDSDLVIVNSRPDVAERAGARGVHLKESGLDPSDVRRAFPRLLIGASRHSQAGLALAVEQGVDYAMLGPVFPTPLKEDRVLRPDEYPSWVTEVGSLPVIAVGGIIPENAAALLSSGVRGVAAIRPFQDAARAADEARGFRAALDRAARAGRD